MSLFHYFNPITNTHGESLTGYQVVARLPNGGAVQSIFADPNGTPIASISGIANTAVSDGAGMVSFFVVPGTYDLEFSSPSGVFVSRISSASLNSGPPGQAATIALGSVTTAPPGVTPSITNSGTPQVAILDFVLPQNIAAADVTLFGAIFDGRDNTIPIQQAATYAAAHGFKAVVCPAGDSFLSATITFAPGVKLVGQGRNATRFRRTGDYGSTFQFGTPGTVNGDGSYQIGTGTAYQSGGASGFWAYHDYGTGAFPPNTAAGMVNPTTKGVMLFAYQPSHCRWDDLWLIGMRGQWASWGGAANVFAGVETAGVYDPAVASLQESLSGWFIDGDGTAIPTDFDMFGCWARGVITAPRAITWPGNHVTTTVVANIGPLDNILIRCAEGIRWHGGYIGAGARSNVRLFPRAICSAISFVGPFVDAAETAGLMLDNTGGTSPTQVTWAPSEHVGQLNGFSAISDSMSNLSNWSVIGLTVRGNYRAFVGPLIALMRAAAADIDINGRNWNGYGFYTGDGDGLAYDAGVKIGDNCGGVKIEGLYGGGAAGDGSGSPAKDAYAVRMSSNGAAARVTLGTLALGVGTQPVGSL